MIVGLKRGVAGYFHVFLKDKEDSASELPNMYIILVDENEVPRYIWVNVLDIHV